MKKIIFIILTISLFCCNKNKSLKITDLNFSDINKEHILKNNIRKTLLISGHDYWNQKKLDTIGLYIYDINGNLKELRINNFFGHRERYEYDSLKLVIKKIFDTDFTIEFNYRYEFDKDSLTLFKYYVKPTMDISEKEFVIPAAVSKFNNDGLITENFQNQDNDYGTGGRVYTKYIYDSLNFLITKKSHFYKGKITDTLFNSITPYKNITTFFYTHKKLDSTITIYHYMNNNDVIESYTDKSIYKDDGLIQMNITMDSIITLYTHQK